MTSNTPDFEQLAQTLIHEAAMVVGALQADTDCLPARRSIDNLLRQVWNARGAADLAAVKSTVSDMVSLKVNQRNLAVVLRALDR